MSNKTVIKPLAIALGATFVTSLAGTTIANAAENPFSMNELSSGYMVVEKAEGKCGEGKCGEGKMNKEGKCGEGKMNKEGKCGGSKAKEAEGKCGGK
ncbi:MAG: low-complexity protein [Thiogranum sp.]